MIDGPPVRGGTSFFSLLRLIRFGLSLGLLVLLAGILWPMAPQGAVGTRQEAEQFYLKMQVFERALENDHYLDQPVTEREINGYLAEIMKKNLQETTPSPTTLKLESINFQLSADSFSLLILAGLGPLRLSYRIEAAPQPSDGTRGFGLRIRRAQWGHIPLPLQTAQWMASRIEKIFSRMKRERVILDRATRLTLEPGRLVLGIGREEAAP